MSKNNNACFSAIKTCNLHSIIWSTNKALDVAYSNVHKEFDVVWCIEGLIAYRSDVDVTLEG